MLALEWEEVAGDEEALLDGRMDLKSQESLRSPQGPGLGLGGIGGERGGREGYWSGRGRLERKRRPGTPGWM
jgi:hypothetical protein